MFNPMLARLFVCTWKPMRVDPQRDQGALPHFDFVEVNGMSLTTPDQLYAELWAGLSEGVRAILVWCCVCVCVCVCLCVWM
jgi:hypothetical protein